MTIQISTVPEDGNYLYSDKGKAENIFGLLMYAILYSFISAVIGVKYL